MPIAQGHRRAIIDQAAQAERKGLAGWLFGSISPPMWRWSPTRIARHASRLSVKRGARASDQGPSAGKYDNTPIIRRILALRHEASRLLDFELRRIRAGRPHGSTPCQVTGFLRQLARAARGAGARDLAELEAFAGRKLDAWDITFYSERLQQRAMRCRRKSCANTLPLPKVLTGLFEVAEQLYGIKVSQKNGVPLAPRRATKKSSMLAAPRSRRSISTRMRGRTSARARGWTTASVVSSSTVS
jgi:oligopeptidase A